MHRLFVAIRPPPAIRVRLLGLMHGIAGARWQDDDQLHLTLRFVGEVDRPQADDLADALGHIRFSPRSEEHTSELQSLLRSSYAVFCLKKKTKPHYKYNRPQTQILNTYSHYAK